MKVRIALCTINPTVGALAANAELILQTWRRARADGADIVVTPEMGLTGYPLQDLTQHRDFLADIADARDALIAAIGKEGPGPAILFGHPTDTGLEDGNRILVYNSATFFDPGAGETHLVHKGELPNYGVFDEKRNYLEGPAPFAVPFRSVRIGIMICEDGWTPEVAGALAADGADALLWINGSPYAQGKNVVRRQHAANRIAETGLPLAYVNLVGGQDELVFDGDTFAGDGASFLQNALFEVGTLTHDFELGPGRATRAVAWPEFPASGSGETYRAVVLGLRDYAAKQGFASIAIAKSGGLDSAVAASIAVDALGADAVHLVRLPSDVSSSHSLVDAAECAALLGCHMRTFAIRPVVEAMHGLFTGTVFDTPRPAGTATRATGLTAENIQPRVRGMVMMAISNSEGHLVVTTGNKSEIAVGYTTIYGDMVGGFNVLKDLFKTEISVAAGRRMPDGRTPCTEADVAALSALHGAGLVQWRNALTHDDLVRYGLRGPAGRTVPLAIEIKEPSAELAEGQRDADSLGDYPDLDRVLEALVERMHGVRSLGGDEAAQAYARRINRLIGRAEYKRRQGAPGPKVSAMHFGGDRRMPITNAWTG